AGRARRRGWLRAAGDTPPPPSRSGPTGATPRRIRGWGIADRTSSYRSGERDFILAVQNLARLGRLVKLAEDFHVRQPFLARRKRLLVAGDALGEMIHLSRELIDVRQVNRLRLTLVDDAQPQSVIGERRVH